MSLTVFTAAAVVLSSLGVGYALGVRSGQRYRHQSKARRVAKRTNADAKPPGEEIDYEIDSDEEEEVKTDLKLDQIRPKFNEPCKLVCATLTTRSRVDPLLTMLRVSNRSSSYG